MNRNIILLLTLVTLAAITSCRDDDIVAYPISDDTGHKTKTEYIGLYVLNEGNMGSNKCTLDYLDLATGVYTRTFTLPEEVLHCARSL